MQRIIAALICLACFVAGLAVAWAEGPAIAPEILPENTAPRREGLLIRAVNSPGGIIEVSRNRGAHWMPLGHVVSPATAVNPQGYTASKWAHDSAVAATAANGIHIKVRTDAVSGRGVIFTICPGGKAIGQAAVELDTGALIVTDIPGGDLIFGGGLGPYVNDAVTCEIAGKQAPLPPSYIPRTGDVLVIHQSRPEKYPLYVTFENKFLQKKPLAVRNGWVSLLVNEDPITLLGVGEKIRDDRSVALEVPRWTEPGKSVAVRLTLENTGESSQAFDLVLRVGSGWTISGGEIKRTLAPGEKADIVAQLTPPPEIRPAVFQMTVSGTVGGRQLSQSKMFGIGSLKEIRHASRFAIDEDLAAWGPPTGIADSKEQVVQGAENWRGPADLAAKVWLRWSPDRELFFAADVTDDKIVTNHRGDDPTRSDSVVLCVDARASWKQFMKDYTPGAFKIVMVPADGNSPATATFEGQPFGEIRKVISMRTQKGYVIGVQVHFRSNLVEPPGWVDNRDIRVGVLVNDSDDSSAGRKTTLGLWRTAADASQDCSSLTTFILQP